MPYELRIAGKAPVRFETEQEAVEAASRAVADDPNVSSDVIDLTTDRGAAPGADEHSREDLRKKVRF